MPPDDREGGGSRGAAWRAQRCRDRRAHSDASQHEKALIMKFVPPDTCLRDYKKRRSAFLDELIASTPNVSLRAKEFRRWDLRELTRQQCGGQLIFLGMTLRVVARPATSHAKDR